MSTPEPTAAPQPADVIREAMECWDRIETAAREQFPNATKEELYEICRSAMNHALGIG